MEPIIDIIHQCSSLEKMVFYRISNSGPLTKPELLKQLNLKHATLSRAVDALMDKGLMIQVELDHSLNVGRKPKLLAVNPTSFYLFGVDISRMHLAMMLQNAASQKLIYIEYALKGNITPEHIIEKIEVQFHRLLKEHSIIKHRVLGLGIGAVGKLDKTGGRIIYADNFGSEWDHVPIRQLLESKLEIPVYLESGANAAAFAEFVMGSVRSYNHALAVNVGVGVRCGVINNGNIVENINHIDSTYGHIVIEPSGKKCTCGNYGCVAAYATIRPIIDDFRRLGKLENPSLPSEFFENITFGDITDLSKKGDRTAVSVLTNAAIYMGIGLANIISILNPEVVALGGPAIEGSDLYYQKAVEVAKSRIYRVEERNITFTKSHFEREAVSMGMCAIMLKQAFKVG